MECIDPNFLKRLKKPKDYGDKLPLIINKEMKEMGIDPDLCDFVYKLYFQIISDKDGRKSALNANGFVEQVKTGKIKIPNNVAEANARLSDCIKIVNCLNVTLKNYFKKFELGMRMNQIAALFILLCNKSLVSFFCS